MYAGAVRDDIIPYVLCYFETLMEKNKLVFELYTRSTITEYRKLINDRANRNLVMKGFQERNTILREERKADILLAMGNAESDFISSKIFELIATGKKIIHIYSYEKDSALPYFKRYPNCCLLNIHDDIRENKNKLIRFLQSQVQYISFKELEKLYKMSTPKYTADKIMELSD